MFSKLLDDCRFAEKVKPNNEIYHKVIAGHANDAFKVYCRSRCRTYRSFKERRNSYRRDMCFLASPVSSSLKADSFTVPTLTLLVVDIWQHEIQHATNVYGLPRDSHVTRLTTHDPKSCKHSRTASLPEEKTLSTYTDVSHVTLPCLDAYLCYQNHHPCSIFSLSLSST